MGETTMRGFVFSASLLCVCGIALGSAHAQATPSATLKPFSQLGYKLIKSKWGVKSYRHTASGPIRVAGEGVIPLPPDLVLGAILDYNHQVGVVDNLEESKILSRSDSKLRVYQRIDLPLVSDRDFTLDVRWGKKGTTKWVTFKALPSGGGKKGAVHVTKHHGKWTLVPTQGGRATYARFEVSIDLAGSIPGWLARRGSGKSMPELYKAMTKIGRRLGTRVARSR
jgi:hypothetical protein